MRMHHQLRDAYQFLEKVEDGALLWGFPSAKLCFPIGRHSNDLFLPGNGIDQSEEMVLGQAGQLAFQGGEIGSLDFDQEIMPDDVDMKTVAPGFDAVPTLSIPIFQGGMKTFFASCAIR